MKKIAVIFLSAAAAVACNGFINLDPISEQGANGFYKGEYEMNQALSAVYSTLQSADQYGSQNGYACFMELPSDNTYNLNTTQNGGRYAAFDNFTVDATNAQVASTWISCYNTIQKANIVIDRSNSPEVTLSETAKAQITGQAYFLRALTYFNLVRIWANVPLITSEVLNVNEAFNHVQSAPADIYPVIISDLEKAINSLPESWPAADAGRATKGAARTLLGKVYLTLGDYSSAMTQLNSVIGKYSLLPKFSDVFSVTNKNNAETIFAVQFDKTAQGEGYPSNSDPMQNGSDVNNLPSKNLIALFNANPDDRKDATIIDAGAKGIRNYKYHDTVGSNNGLGFDIIVLRYADVLLMAAEALNEQNYGGKEALGYLNDIRKRAHATEYTYTDLPNQGAFRDAVEKERRLELAFENHRWFDLVRTGKALSVVNANDGGSVLKVNAQKYQLLFPIPQSEIDASGNKLVPNEGY